MVSRALIGVWAFWLTAALSEAPGLHTCAVHDHAAHAGAMAHSGHAMDMGHATKAPTPTDHSQHSTGCTCLGMCCCAATVATPAPSFELAAGTVVSVAAPLCTDVESPVIERAYSLPFANGPPTA